MIIDFDYLIGLGFTDFIHLQESDRDGRKRMVWMQIVQNEIITFRLVLSGQEWLIDYASPERLKKHFDTTGDLLEYLKLA